MESLCTPKKKKCYSDYMVLLHHIGEPENKESPSPKKGGNDIGTCYKQPCYKETPMCPEVVQGVSALTKSSIQIQTLASRAQKHFKRLEDDMAQGQDELLPVIKR